MTAIELAKLLASFSGNATILEAARLLVALDAANGAARFKIAELERRHAGEMNALQAELNDARYARNVLSEDLAKAKQTIQGLRAQLSSSVSSAVPVRATDDPEYALVHAAARAAHANKIKTAAAEEIMALPLGVANMAERLAEIVGRALRNGGTV